MRHILVVDDDAQVRFYATTLLTRAGYRVSEARNGNEATQLLSRETPDVMLTDIVMPYKEGLQLILEVRRDHPEVCIIAMSGGAVKAAGLYLESAKAFGADCILPKPFVPDDLLRTIEEVCEAGGSETA